MIELVKRGYQVVGSGGRAGDDMKVFVTGVGGQLGHDCVNELVARGHEAVGSDIQQSYSGVNDGTAVVTVPYVQLDITNQSAVKKTIEGLRPDVIIHCAAWTAVDAAEDIALRLRVPDQVDCCHSPFLSVHGIFLQYSTAIQK